MSFLASRAAKRITKAILITFGVLVVLLFGGVWGLNRWLKSPELHAKVERELSLELKLPLKFQTLNLSVFGGLTAEGVTVMDRGRNFFEATSMTAAHDFFSLLRGKLVFKEIKVNAPRFVVVQRKTGEWKMPDLPPDLQAELDARKKAKQAAKSTETKPEKTASATPKPKKAADVQINKVRITNGNAEFFEQDGRAYVSAMGIGATLSDVREESVMGYVAVERLVWHGNVAGTDVGAAVSFTEKGIIVEKIKACLGQGTLSGGYSSKPDQPGDPFSFKVAVEKVNLGRAAAEADAPPPNLDGILTGTLELRGMGGQKKSYLGKSAFVLKDATCREIDWVNQLGEVIQQEDMDLTTFKIDQMKADLMIGNERIFIKSIAIDAPPLGLTGEGACRFDGSKLDLKANFLAEKNFLARRPQIEPQFGPPDANQMRGVAFNLTGSLGKPKQNLMEKITGTTDRTEQRIKLGVDLLNGLKLDSEAERKAAPGGRE